MHAVQLLWPNDCSPPGSSVHGIFQSRILKWAAFPPPGDLPNPGIELGSLTSAALAGRFFTTATSGETRRKESLSQVWLCDPMDYSLPGSARFLPWNCTWEQITCSSRSGTKPAQRIPWQSLAVQWLGLDAFMAKAHSLVGELRLHKPQGMAKINNFPHACVLWAFST